MKEYIGILTKAGLFGGIESADLEKMLNCLGSEIKNTGKNEILLLAGDKPENIGIVLSGRLHIIREDHNGNRSLMGAITLGGVFAEALCCAGVSESPVTVVADTDSIVMLLRFSRILHTCPNSCGFHTKLIENMLGLIANKNLLLQNRMDIISQKSIRAKITRYFESFAPRRGTEFSIPFNREKLAEFLCVDRSALSHELSNMKRDGLIEYRRNVFVLKTNTSLK